MTPEDDHHERIKSAGVDTHFIRHIPCHLPPRRRFIFTDTILTGSRYGCDTARYLTLHTPYARPAYLVTVYTNDTIRRYDAHLPICYGTMRYHAALIRYAPYAIRGRCSFIHTLRHDATLRMRYEYDATIHTGSMRTIDTLIHCLRFALFTMR